MERKTAILFISVMFILVCSYMKWSSLKLTIHKITSTSGQNFILQNMATNVHYTNKSNPPGQADDKGYQINNTEKTTRASYFIYDDEKLYKTIQAVRMNYKQPRTGQCKKRVPQCIILGVKKAGTRELIDFMSLHPNIVIKRNPYEIGYFTSKQYKPNPLGNDWYRQQMPCSYSDQITVTKYPWYFSNPKAAERIYNFNKTMKLIVIVRDPVKRLISGYTFANRRRTFGKQGEDFSKLPPIEKELLRKDGAINEKYEEVKLSSYDVSLSYYLKYFTLDQILFIESNEFKYTPHIVLKRIEAFLGLKDVISEDNFVFNSEKKFYCIKYNNKGFCYGIQRGRVTQPDLSEDIINKLQRYFSPHNERFYEMIGKRYNW